MGPMMGRSYDDGNGSYEMGDPVDRPDPMMMGMDPMMMGGPMMGPDPMMMGMDPMMGMLVGMGPDPG